VRQNALFYGFSLEDHVPQDHLLRSIDRFVEILLEKSALGSVWGGRHV
jgi:transposase